MPFRTARLLFRYDVADRSVLLGRFFSRWTNVDGVLVDLSEEGGKLGLRSHDHLLMLARRGLIPSLYPKGAARGTYSSSVTARQGEISNGKRGRSRPIGQRVFPSPFISRTVT
jgi:hypothetical protein